MQTLTDNERAYIAIIAFGERAGLIKDRQGRPFIMSVDNILKEFGVLSAMQRAGKLGKQWEGMEQYEKNTIVRQVSSFADYLYDQLSSDSAGIDRSGTNVTEALKLAHEISMAAISGSLSKWGLTETVSLRTPPVPKKGQIEDITVPNVRVMIYSDGEHNRGYLVNPFNDMQPASVLMTAFIGKEDADDNARKGAEQMLEIATTCPEHGHKGYFLINTLGRRMYLREVFHMATGHSGFCRQCAAGSGVVLPGVS